jgi:hypothetical protein
VQIAADAAGNAAEHNAIALAIPAAAAACAATVACATAVAATGAALVYYSGQLIEVTKDALTQTDPVWQNRKFPGRAADPNVGKPQILSTPLLPQEKPKTTGFGEGVKPVGVQILSTPIAQTGNLTLPGFAIDPNAGKAIIFYSERAKNNLKPDPSAAGAHTTIKYNPITGVISNYATWTINSQNPTGWDLDIKVDLQGRGHTNTISGSNIPTPHVQGKSIPGGVRPANSSEIPAKK